MSVLLFLNFWSFQMQIFVNLNVIALIVRQRNWKRELRGLNHWLKFIPLTFFLTYLQFFFWLNYWYACVAMYITWVVTHGRKGALMLQVRAILSMQFISTFDPLCFHSLWDTICGFKSLLCSSHLELWGFQLSNIILVRNALKILLECLWKYIFHFFLFPVGFNYFYP